MCWVAEDSDRAPDQASFLNSPTVLAELPSDFSAALLDLLLRPKKGK
jgi:hypothetical protein